jgi:hypothetical protein
MWVIPPEQNADFVYQMEQLLDVYKRPYDPVLPVVCLDESPKQLVSETRKPIKMPDGSTRYDYEYEPKSTCALNLWLVAAALKLLKVMTASSGQQ